MHGVAVLGAQLEDVAHFDALGQLDGAAAARAGVAQGDAAQVGVGRDLHVAAQVHVHQMRVSGVGAHHIIGGTLQLEVGVDGHIQTHGTGKAQRRGRDLFHHGGRSQFHGGGVEQVLELDVVDFAVAAHQHGHGLAVHHEEHGLDHLRRSHLEHGAHFFHGVGRRRGDLFVGGAGLGAGGAVPDHFGAFHVGGIAAFGAGGDGVFAGIGQHHELVREIAADGAGVGFHGAEAQAQTLEDAAVGVVHQLVAFVGTGIAGIEGIGVLHDEFTAAHQAEAGADLVAELGLDLVQTHGQLAVGAHFAAHQVGDDFLMRGAKAVIAVVAVLEAQQLLAVVLPAAGLFPEVAGDDHGHEQLGETGGVHFLAHHALHVFQGLQAQRQVDVHAGGELADHAGAQQQLVADHFRFGRGFLERGDVGGAETHQ